MEPSNVSNRRTNPSLEPTAEETEAGGTPPPERPEIRATDEPPPSPPAVQSLVDKHDSASPPQILPTTNASAPAAGTPAHRGVALSVGVNVAVGSVVGVGGELNVGIVVDLTDPDISVFASSGGGEAKSTLVSGGVTGQLSYVHDLAKFNGPGVEVGVNTPRAGVAANFARSGPGGAPELNGGTISVGRSVGADLHWFESTTKQASVIANDIADGLRRFVGLPPLRRFGP